MSDRYSPRGMDPEGVGDGNYMLTVAGGVVTGLTPAASGGGSGVVESIVPGSGIAVDSTDPANPIVSATGGGGGSAVRDLRWYCPTGAISIDEFNDDSTSGLTAINPTGAAAGNVSWVELGDTLGVELAGGDSSAAVHAQAKSIGGALATGDAFSTAMQIWSPGGNYTMGGLALSDSASTSGNQLMALVYQGSTQVIEGWQAASWGGATKVSGTGSLFANVELQRLLHVRLVFLGGTTWRVDVSPNGTVWRKSATFTKSIAPTHMGVIASSWGTSTKAVIAYDYMRRHSGVT